MSIPKGTKVAFGKVYYNGKYYSHMIYRYKKLSRYQWEEVGTELSGIGAAPGAKQTYKRLGATKKDEQGNTYTTVNPFYSGFSELNCRIEYASSGYGTIYVGKGRAMIMWRVPIYWLLTFEKGGGSFKIRGDGIFKFNDGTTAKVNTKVVDGAVSVRQTTIKVPKSATEAIYVGTFSNIGTLRETGFNTDEDIKAFNVPFADFSKCSLKTIQFFEDDSQLVGIGEKYYEKDEIFYGLKSDGYTHLSWYEENVLQKSMWSIYFKPIYVQGINGVLKKNGDLPYAYYRNRKEFTRLPTFCRAFANTPIGSVDDIWPLIQMIDKAISNYTGIDYLTDELYLKTGAMSTVECFRGCRQLKKAKFYHSYDAGYMYADCTSLEGWELGFWNDHIAFDKSIRRRGQDGQGTLEWSPPSTFQRVRGMFKNCTSLKSACEFDAEWAGYGEKIQKGTKLWHEITPTYRILPHDKGYIITSNGCFEGCTGMSDYDEIPDWWKMPYGTECYSETLYPGKEITT